MTKKDYQLIADVIAGLTFDNENDDGTFDPATENMNENHRLVIAQAFASVLKADPDFKTGAFFASCNLSEGNV